ncbi:MAG: DUF814 domain-containing protein [Verrucomicrobia bacterium]|nr:DUF814 domain-containing protein [Cytophagales bacterium]
MQTNYYFLRKLSRQLNQKLKNCILETCFSQEKDELVLGFSFPASEQEFYIKAVLQPDLATLVFMEEFSRAKRNSVGLFKQVIGKKVLEVIQYDNERAFGILFEADFLLVFKLFGNRSNLLLFEGNTFLEMFNNKLGADAQINPENLSRQLDISFKAFGKNDYNIQKTVPTLGKIALHYLESQRFINESDKWTAVLQLFADWENPIFYITIINQIPALSLLPIGEIQFQTQDAVEACNAFYNTFARVNFFEKEQQIALRKLEKHKTQTENYLLKTYQKLSELENESRNEQTANILMANLHQIPENTETVELYDFYHDKIITIKLKKSLSPQKNAETFYRKSKNEKIEITKIQENIAAKEAELQNIEVHQQEINTFEDLRTLRKYLKEHQLTISKISENPREIFKKYNFMGFDVLVGRNAKNNDVLTQKFAYKEDLWLHAKDVAGSHVIIKYQSGKTFPEPVIEKAAQLAAFYSKRRTDSLCPVIVTPKKFVRKTKDLAEGQVIVEKEDILLVVPQLPEV